MYVYSLFNKIVIYLLIQKRSKLVASKFEHSDLKASLESMKHAFLSLSQWTTSSDPSSKLGYDYSATSEISDSTFSNFFWMVLYLAQKKEE